MPNNKNPFNIRTVEHKDLPGIMMVENSAFKGMICEKEEVFMERIKIFPEGFLVLESEEKIQGYICSEIWQRRDKLSKDSFNVGHSISSFHQTNGNELYISSMGILPDFHGKGLGRKLFEYFLAYAKNAFPKIKSMVLIVSENWYSARKIYSGNGFAQIADFKGFFEYADNIHSSQNGIVMRKELLQKKKTIL